MYRFFILGMIVLLIVSCQSAATQPALIPVSVPTSVVQTLVPTLPPSPTAVISTIQAKDLPVNCRFGPGVVYEIISGLQPGQVATVVGKDATNLWWQIRDPGNPGNFCWVDGSTVDAHPNAEDVPVANPALVTVTKLDVQVEPERVVISCSAFPQVFVFKANITVNGPTLVTWRWDVSTGESSPDQLLIFEEAGTQSVQEFYRIQSPNDYSVFIHVTQPNDMTARANFFAQCAP